MSEENVEDVPVEEQPQGEQAEEQSGPAETDWKAESRKWEARAKSSKADADKWRQYEESQKSEDEKRAEELERVRGELASERTSRLKLEIAAEKGIPSEAIKLLDGSTREEIEEKAAALLQLIGDQSKPKAPKPDSDQGRVAGAGTSTADMFANAIGELL
jgi:uncharacterized FlaG/YvyC family protein